MAQSISIATKKDKPDWARLRCLLWPDCSAERHELEVEQLLGSEGLVALAVLDGKVIGFAEVSIRRDHVEGTSAAPVPYLEGWFVEKQYRGKGIGRALVRFVEEWARGKGFLELASDAEIWNEASIRAHGQLGFSGGGENGAFREEVELTTRKARKIRTGRGGIRLRLRL